MNIEEEKIIQDNFSAELTLELDEESSKNLREAFGIDKIDKLYTTVEKLWNEYKKALAELDSKDKQIENRNKIIENYKSIKNIDSIIQQNDQIKLDEKDKVIELMANYIRIISIMYGIRVMAKDDIIREFENEAKR